MDQDGLFDRGAEEGLPRVETPPPRIGAKRLRHAERNQVEFQECSLDELLPEEHEGADRLGIRLRPGFGGPCTRPFKRSKVDRGRPPPIPASCWRCGCTPRSAASAGAGTEPLVRVPRGVSLDLRRRVDELSHPLRLSHTARRTARSPADGERGQLDGRGLGDAGPRGAGRDEGSRQCRGGLVPPPAHAGRSVDRGRKPSGRSCGGNWRPIRGPARPANKRRGRGRPKNERRGFAPRWSRCPRLRRARRRKTGKKPAFRRPMPVARVMKMGDGGFRPAFNVQLATATDSQVITGLEVTNSGGDQGQLAPMVEQHQQRYDETPREALVDGGFVKKADIDQVSPPQGGTTVYAPVMEPRDPRIAIGTPLMTMTVRRWRSGDNGWPPTRRSSSTANGLRRRSV